VTRDLSLSGITAAKIAPMLMSRTMTPNPAPNSAPNSIAKMTGRGPAASGTSASGAVKMRQAMVYVSPAPSRAVSRLVTTEPSTPPTAPAPSTRPSRPGWTCSDRVA